MERSPGFNFLGFWFISVILLVLFFLPNGSFSAEGSQQKEPKEKLITLDFNNVDLPVFIKFISELTGKNFVIDERVRGKVTIFSPSKISTSRAYEVFLSVMDLKGFSVVPTGEEGEIYQVVPSNEVPPDRDVHVYTLENTNAEDVAKVLLGMVARAPGPARRGRRRQGEILGTVQVLADKNTNSLVITATEDDFEILKGVIQKLDTKRRQVFVEAAILEVGLEKLRDLGTDIAAAFGYQTPDGNLTVLGGINANPADFTSIGTVVPNLALSTVNVRALLHLLQSSTDTNILSTPQLLTSDNQKAEITVGQNVPFPGSQSQTVGGNVQTTIERKDVGVILRLTPQILENNLIKMDVYQEISSLVDTPQVVQNIVLGPTTNKRTANTTVIAKSEETIVIGGLIRDNVTKSESKIPLLGDIPLIGFFFRHTTRRVEKTNLLIFLTPHLVRDEKEMEALKVQRIDQMNRFMEEKKDEFYGRRSEMLRGMVNVPVQRLP